MGDYTFNIKKMNLSEIPDGAICVFIGKRKSGKSFCIRDLLWHKQDIPTCNIFSGSEKANPFFSDFMPSTFIETELDCERVASIISRQEQLLDKQKEEPEKYANADPRTLIIFDDVLHDSSWKKSKAVKNIFMNGRHYKIFFILAMQYVLGIGPSLRCNVDYTFIFRDSSLQNRRKIYDCFGGAVPNFDMFCQLMDSLDKYECLVICNNADKVTLEEQVLWYKAVDNGNFKFGCQKMWDFHRKVQAAKKKNAYGRATGKNIAEYRPSKKNRATLRINKYG